MQESNAYVPGIVTVYPFDFADPFVLRARDGYYAYGTTRPGPEGKIFPVLHSTDLVHWQSKGGSLYPLADPPGVSYWAPEVLEHNGAYYMFFSASTTSSDESHRIRVAISANPVGPFADTGRFVLPDIGFSIDASPFHDPVSGKHYLFFASDYEADEPHGTGIAVVQLSNDLFSTIGPIRPVLRALGDWQVYERDRNYKARIWKKWFCVEGPHCIFRDGKYYCFYSGGAWYGDNYGVGYAVADHPEGPWKDEFGSTGPFVLKGIPDKVIGPGHVSCFLAPDDQTLLMAYHAWDPAKTARRMCFDPLLWRDGRPRVDGPTTELRTLVSPSQPSPAVESIQPAIEPSTD